nr:uncharacterized protein LOC109185082 [Ipomoea batatas]
MDIKEVCDRPQLELVEHNGRYLMPKASYSLSRDQQIASRRTRIGQNLNDGGIDPDLPTTLSIFNRPGHPISAKGQRYLDIKERFTAHQYILLICEDVQPILRLYETGLRQYNPGATNEEIDQEVERSFANWFRDYVYNPANNVGNQALIDFACGLLMQVTTYNGYVVNGFKFQTEQHCIRKSTNNFGVSIKGTSLSHGDSLFFGTLKEIVEVEYPNIPLKKVVLFNCEWFDPTPNTGTNLNSDSGLAEVHSRKRYRKYDPFIIAQNACQVCYIPYPRSKREKLNWWVVLNVRPRGTIDNAYKHIETYQQDSIHVPTNDVSVVQEEVEELLHVPVVLTEVNVHPISGPDELDDQNEIEDDGEETDQEVVLEDTDDPEEGNAHIRATQSNEVRRHLEDTDSERTASASRESEHTTEAVTEHTSQPASEPSTPPSTIPNDRRTLIPPIGEKA